jgi:putative tryptophan/tyrosine transport system substrate-binding protein
MRPEQVRIREKGLRSMVKVMIKRGIISAVSSMLIAFGGCGHRDNVFTIGIVNNAPANSVVLEGFKKGMAELGYVEGRDVRYIYNDTLESSDQIINTEIKKFLNQDVSLLLTISNETALIAKKDVEGTEIPVLAVACARPVEIGLVRSLNHPGGNVTGIQVSDTIPKGFEWLARITPNAKKIYIPYNPDDNVSIMYLDALNKTASQLGIELVLHKVHSVEEAVTAIEGLPDDVNAVFRIPSPTLTPRSSELNQAAIRRGIPIGAGTGLDFPALITFGSDNLEIGRQAARMTSQIIQGLKPADIPFETSEAYLSINLKTAEQIGLKIPDDVLSQARTIIR